MNNIEVSATRNFVVMGHTGSGKTTLIDAILFKLGLNDRLGSVSGGSSMADWTDTEKSRKLTLLAKPFGVKFKAEGGREHFLVFCDTPGYMDFYGQVIAASSVSDSALIVVDATSGIQLGTKKAWARAQELGLPCAVAITGMDRENADFNGVVEKIQTAWGGNCVPVVMPSPDGKGVVDVVTAKDPSPEAELARGSLVELAVETDDALLERYLGGAQLQTNEILDGLRKSVKTNRLVPIFACSPLKDMGVRELLEGIVRYMPSPLDRKGKDADGKEIDPSPTAPLSAFVWRVVNDPHVGNMTFLKVYGGTFKSDSEVFNATKGEKERIGNLILVNGKTQAPATSATAGDIVALTKLKHTKLNDAICAPGHKVAFKPLVFPNPVTWFAVVGKTRNDEDKIGAALAHLVDEDPTIRIEQDKETHETRLSGMGDVHLDVAVEHMKIRSNVEVVLSTPKVPYRETVTSTGDGHYKHKKQTGGRGQYGEVYLRVGPRKTGDEEWFVNDIVGGAIPTNFIPAVEKGLVEALVKGTIGGFPVTNVRVSVYDGTFHDVDSSEIAFKIAASRAFKEGMSKAKPVLLEPIMTVRIMVPDHYMGDVSSDISHKRGRILGIAQDAGVEVITAEIPQAELFRYAAELRSMTSGQGTFDLTFGRYEIVPASIAQKVVAASSTTDKEKEQED